jgi:hypothetical protein
MKGALEMIGRLRTLGIVLAVFSLVFVAAGAFTAYKVNEGRNSLQDFSAAQNVKLSYNDQGQFVSGGKVEEGAAILAMLKNDWGYNVAPWEMDKNDPLVNTPSEYMVQMATIAYHTLNSTQTVVLPTDVTAADGTVYKAGSYDFPVDGRYWAAFNRSNPIEAKAREQAWTGTAHALIAELGVGSVTGSTLQMGAGLAALFFLVGLVTFTAGAGLVWATRAAAKEAKVAELKLSPIPA